MGNAKTPDTDQSESVLHIVSLVVHVQPGVLEMFSGWVADQPELEVHVSSADGKLVVVLEISDHRRINPLLDTIRDQEGVLSVVMVYHEELDASVLSDELAEGAASSDETQPVKILGAL